jgi:membrane associated rhomboid family serine protease
MAVALIVLNLTALLYQSFYVPDTDSFVNAWGLIPAVVRSGEGLYTLAASLFLHGNAIHLAGNMFFLWIFGDNVEEDMGHIPFLAFYLLFGIAGGALHILANPLMKIPAIGSSGAVAGVMGAYFVLYPQAKLKTFIINRVIDVPALYYIGAWIFLQGVFAIVYFSGGVTGGLAWFGHLGGFISGVIITWLLKRAKGK